MCFFARVTAPFSHTWTLKFKAQPTNAFIATFQQIFGRHSQLPDYCRARGNQIKSLSTVQTTWSDTSWKELPNI